MPSTRRQFLQASLGASAILSFAPGMPSMLARAAAMKPADKNDRVLIVLQLSGGNDGLNSVAPYEDDAYGRNRPTLRLMADEVHKIDDGLGLHPEMGAMHRHFQDGRVSIVQGVGYPGHSENHPVAMRVWQTGVLDADACDTGWLGRAIDHASETAAPDMPGMFVSPIRAPLTINAASSVVPSVHRLENAAVRAAPGVDEEAYVRTLARASAKRDDGGNALLAHARSATRAGCEHMESVRKALADTRISSGADYPRCTLAESLQTIAKLIRADVGARIFYTELGGDGFGGFDNHAAQKDNHAALLRQMSESIAAFVDDLADQGLLDRVLLMTFSEFGRTLAENGRRGTGHGAAAPVFLAGGALRGGLIGPRPTFDKLENNGVKVDIDLRRVYATVLDQWLGYDAEAVLGERFEPIDIVNT